MPATTTKKSPVKKDAPAVLPNMHRAGVRSIGNVRTIKMLRPICATCQRGKDIPMGWWFDCEHGPYISAVEVPVTSNKYEDLEDGTKRLIGKETIVHWEEHPNWVQVPHMLGVGQLKMVEKKQRRAGFILPEDLRSETYPNGIARCCEYRNCFVQTNLIDTQWGSFCRKVEAQLIGHVVRQNSGGGALEIGPGTQQAEKQRAQLDAVAL